MKNLIQETEWKQIINSLISLSNAKGIPINGKPNIYKEKKIEAIDINSIIDDINTLRASFSSNCCQANCCQTCETCQSLSCQSQKCQTCQACQANCYHWQGSPCCGASGGSH